MPVAGCLFFGIVAGVCAAPIWVMLALPMRITDILQGGSMKMCALALTAGAAAAGMTPVVLPGGWGLALVGLLFAGVFVGMLASALTEALEVIPVLYERLHIASDLRWAALALMLGKGIGALIATVFV